MSEMVERAERAFCEAIGKDYDGYRGYYEVAIRAAIEAMREPTAAQEAVMRDLLERDDRPPTKRWHWIWHEMIDAALHSEKVTGTA